MIYKTKMVEGPNRNFEIFDPLDFLAAVTSHIPNRGEHLVRYYGYYSSVQRGRRRRQGRERMPLGPPPLSDNTAPAKAARVTWARFIKKVFAADPLVCPDCGGAMRIIAFIEDRRVVRAILKHLSLWDEPRPPPDLPAAARVPLELEYCPGWSELHRAPARQSAASQRTLRLFMSSGDLLGFTTPQNLDFGFRQRDNPRENQAITATGGLATISFDSRRGRKFL